MEFANGVKDVVDPEVRAYVSSLVTALGGSGADENGHYVLGDDALACLRDLKRWLKLYDEKANRLDVARCLAESNLVGGDLLQILAAWPENATDDKLKAKIALACLELLVPLTWPIEKNLAQMTVNHHRHIPYLEIAQLGYKRSIINFDGARILNTAVRCALPSMAQSPGDRSTRDEGIIKLVLYFLRNMAMIAPLPNVKYDGDEAEISRSATIDAFDYQDIFHLLLMICSTMGEDFNTQDVVVMDILFHLVKGIDIEKLFMTELQLDNSHADELVELRKKEAALLRGYQKSAPSRHNRFGAMAWISRENSKKTAISGQSAMTDATRGLAKMDSTKKFKPPRRPQKGNSGPMDFDTPVGLSPTANKHLRTFVEDFIDSGFNPLFSHIRKAIDREADRVLEIHSRQFFYLVAWFLEAERVRRKTRAASISRSAKVSDVESFSLVAGVLNQEMFVTLNRAMDTAYEHKSWEDLNATMRCFTQILLTVQEMSECPLEDDQDIAENILSRIFYEETTHDRVANITRTYKDQGFGYLDACTNLCHNYLRILEQYSKQNVDLQVRSKRRVRRKKKAARAAGNDEPDDDIVDESENEDEARAEQTSRERKFDFKRFAARFLVQGCVDTFIAFTHFYNDLKPSQLKRAHRYFYRVAFKQDMSVMLFRVDIIALFHKMIKGPEGLDSSLPAFKEWNDLVKQLIKKCTRKIEERPELVVEMLFSKISSTAHFLEYGYDKQTVTSKPRAAAPLEIRPAMDWEKQIGIVVSAMLDRNEGDLLQFVKSQLSSAENERKSWEEINKAASAVRDDPFAGPETTLETTEAHPPSIIVKPSDARRKTAMFKNGYLRLLMTLVGFERVGVDDDPDGTWVIPASLSADQLKQSLDLINQNEFSPPAFDDGKEAGDFIKRVSSGVSRKREAFDDESDNGIDDDDEEPLFPAGGPTAMKKADALDALKKNRRLRRKKGDDDEDNGLTDEQLKARAEARRAKEMEKNRKVKSELYVNDSADEDDEERDKLFFEQEEKLRQRSNINIMKELLGVNKSKDNSSGAQRSKKRKSTSLLEEDDDLVITSNRKRQSTAIAIDSDDEDASSSATADENEDSDNQPTYTPLSSPHPTSSQPKRRKVSSNEGSVQPVKGVANDKENEPAGVLDDDDDEEDMPVTRPARQRIRAGFVMDSSDEE